MTDIVILDGARTPFGKYCGSLKDINAVDLGVVAADAAIKRSGLMPDQIDNVVLGHVLQTCRDSHLISRHVGIKAKIPFNASALTINRICGSGLEAVLTAARFLITGESNIALAGGAENMSQAPFLIRGARTGIPFGRGELEDSLWHGLRDGHIDMSMGHTAEKLARIYKISREEQDEFALRSHKAAAEASQKGWLMEEIIPVEVGGKNKRLFDSDEIIRADANMAALSKLPPAFYPDGSVTAGNASAITDGAAAVTLTTAKIAKNLGIKPLGRLVKWGVEGVDPTIMGTGPIVAINKILREAKVTLDKVDLIEINEAFAAQYLACEKNLKLDREKVNVNGGAIAIGHPLGASGARLLLSLLYELRRRGKRYGIASLCIGGGQGIAALVECLQA